MHQSGASMHSYLIPSWFQQMHQCNSSSFFLHTPPCSPTMNFTNKWLRSKCWQKNYHLIDVIDF
jgi:hypothetical protein